MTSPSGGSTSVDEDDVSASGVASAPESANVATTFAKASPITSEPTASSPADSEAGIPETEACAKTGGWDAAAERSDFSLGGAIVNVEGNSGDCYDSVTFRINPSGVEPGYLVEYVPAVIMDGSGLEAPVASAAKLQVTLDSPTYFDSDGRLTPSLVMADRNHVVDASRFSKIEQVAFAGSFEGQTTFGIGVAAELPFAVGVDVDADGSTVLTVYIAHE